MAFLSNLETALVVCLETICIPQFVPMIHDATVRVKNGLLQMAGRTLWLLIAVLLVVAGVQAQPVDTVVVKLTDTVPTYSHYRHWQNAVYRWTVDGGGKVGQFGGKNKVEIDARFALTNFVFGGIPITNPKLPIEDNGGLYAVFCGIQPEVCNTFLATNAVEQAAPPEYALENFVLNRNASLLKRYRFVPDGDSYNAGHTYTKTVIGSDLFAQYMFIDRYGETGYEAYYADNSENNLPTTFRVVIERQSPELILTAIHDSTIVLNDDDRSVVLRNTNIDVGTLSLQAVSGGASLITQQVFRNRGLEQLRIDSIQATGDITDFNIISSDKWGNTPSLPLLLDRYIESADLLRLEVRFVPKSIGEKTLTIRLYCNDTTQNPDGQKRFFELLVRGKGTDARLSVVDVIDFGAQPVGGGPVIKKLVITSAGSSAAEFGYTPPRAPFGLAKEGGSDVPDPVFGLGTNQQVRVDVSFNPAAPGDYLDSIIIGGGNTQRYVVYLKGRGEMAALVLAADTIDLAQDTIYFGVTRAGIPLFKPFYVRNIGNVKLSIEEPLVPHYSVSAATDADPYPTDKVEFTPAFAFGVNNIDTISNRWQAFAMKFEANAFLRTGQIEAKLKIGVSVPEKTPDGRDTFRIIVLDSFLLVARKLQSRPEAIDRIEFDSVYVGNPCSDSRVNWNITNKVEQEVKLTGQRAEIIHSNNGLVFSLTGLNYPVLLAQNETASPIIEYKPTQRGPDTVRYYVHYTSGKESDSIDVLLTGVGVQQELRLDSAIQDLSTEYYQFPGDTIDLGNVRVGMESSVTAFFANKGNLPFRMRANGQVLKEEIFPNGGFNYATVSGAFPSATVQIDSTARTTIRVLPTRAGQYLLRCEIASDIIAPERGIKCVPASAAARIFFVRFNAIKPVAQTDRSELDFGSVIFVETCPRSKELSVRINNTGNSSMQVQLPVMQKGNPFEVVAPQPLTIAAGNFAVVKVRFTPTGTGVYNDTLLLLTDAGLPDSTVRIPVHGEAVSPQSVTVSLPVLTARPGRRIAIPIVVERPDLLTSIRSFTTTLLYDGSLLVYSGIYNVAGTAAQSASRSDVKIDDSTPGTLDVEITLPTNTFFQEKDTLIVLYFDTYLGQKPLTSIDLRNTDFGDGDCKGLLGVQLAGGAFALDSVCNLGSLIGPAASGMFRLEQNTPNPAGDDAFIEYEVAFSTDVKIDIFDARGNRVAAIADGWHYSGTYKVPVPVHNLAPGLYFYEMKAGIFREVRKMYIAK